MLTENREFNEIYEQYKNLILKAAYTYSGSYSAAEDITQDTFLKLYMGYDSMKKKNISSWLFIKCTLCQGHYDFFLFRFLLYICLLCRGIKVMPLIDCFHLLL